MEGYDHLNLALDQPPSYETEDAPYGMRAAALRRKPDGRTYVRITEWFAPLATIVPVGGSQPNVGSMFVIAPVDDTHHLLFYGYFGETPQRPPQQLGGAAPDYVADPSDFAGVRGDRTNRWGQDRELIRSGHITGFGRNLLEEDAVVQTSMGPILDRTTEHLSSSDVAVAHARRILLDASTPSTPSTPASCRPAAPTSPAASASPTPARSSSTTASAGRTPSSPTTEPND